jgi:predicted thioredoxin/glutaredoxin
MAWRRLVVPVRRTLHQAASKETHMDIKVLGTRNPNGAATLALIDEVARAMGVRVRLQRADDFDTLISHGVMSTPGIVIDGRLVHAGGVPSRNRVEDWLERNG